MYEEASMADCDERVMEWEVGLPSAEDLTPLSQPLIPPELATAFSISPEPRRSAIDVNRASQDTLSSIRGQLHALSSSGNVNFKSFNDEEADPTMDGSDPRKLRRIEGAGCFVYFNRKMILNSTFFYKCIVACTIHFLLPPSHFEFLTVTWEKTFNFQTKKKELSFIIL